MPELVLKRLTDTLVVAAGLALFAMMIHVSADVVLKYVTNRPIPGTLELVSAYYMVAGVFLPIAAVELVRASISVDVAYQFLPRGMKVLCMVLVLAVSVVIYWVLTWTSFGDAMRSLRIREVMMGNVLVSVWISRFVLPISFALAGLVCFVQLVGFLTNPNTREKLLATSDMPEDV